MKKKQKRPEGAATPSSTHNFNSTTTISLPIIIKIGNSTIAEIKQATVCINGLCDYHSKRIIKGHVLKEYLSELNIKGMEVVING